MLCFAVTCSAVLCNNVLCSNVLSCTSVHGIPYEVNGNTDGHNDMLP